MTFLWTCAIQATVILSIAIVSLPLLRKRSAALRHWVLSSAIFFSALVPALNLIAPLWDVPAEIANHPFVAPLTQQMPTIVPSPPSPALISAEPTAARTGPRVRQNEQPVSGEWLVEAVWLAGAAIGLFVLVAGLLRLRWLSSVCLPMASGPWTPLVESISREYRLGRPVQVLQSRNASILVTWGAIRPRIILPEGAEEWSQDRARMVLRHELAHIRRFDWVVQLMAQVVRIAYWFNPLVWIVCNRLRLESECACDDAVLSDDIEGHLYADHLLALARTLNTTGQAWSAVLTMARPSTLERRFSAMLNPVLNRRSATRTAMLVTVFAGLCVVAPLALITSIKAAPPQEPVRLEPGGRTVIEPPGSQLSTIEPRINLLVEYPGTIRQTQFRQADTEGGTSAEGAQMLIKLYESTKEMDLKRHILDYLAASTNPQASEKILSVARSDSEKDLRRHAIDYLAGKANAFDALVSLYDDSRDTDIKRHVLDYIASIDTPQAAEKLLSVARSDSEQPDLRRHAIDYIAGNANFETLVSLYDSSREPDMKRHIMDYLASSNDSRVMEKLFSIAQSDPNPDLRRHAVDYIAVR